MSSRRTFLKTLTPGLLGLGTWARCAGTTQAVWPVSMETDDDFWRFVRAQYPLTHDRTYLNAGGLGPAPHAVLDAVQRTTMELQEISESGHHLIGAAREVVAAFLNATPAEIAFMRNATEGNSTIAFGLDLRAGDEVIFESHAHPGGSFPWLSRHKAEGIRVNVFEPDPASAAGNLERIEALITARTRVIQVSHVTAPTGIRMPVEEIATMAQDRGLWFHIDGAQSAGMFPVDLRAIGCDSYAASGHKWLGAPHGTGLLYVREDRIDAVTPTESGAYGDSGPYRLPVANQETVFNYNPTATRFEPGTRNAGLIVGVAAAVEFMSEIGMARVAQHGQGLAQYLQAGLREIPGVTILTPADAARSASMTSFRTAAVPFEQLNGYFNNEWKLRTRPVQEQGLNAVRVSTHTFNSRTDCDRVIEATRKAVEEA